MSMHTNNYEHTWPTKCHIATETYLRNNTSMYNTSNNIHGLKSIYKMSHSKKKPTDLKPYKCI